MRISMLITACTFASLVACSGGDATVGSPVPVDPDSGSTLAPAPDAAVADSGATADAAPRPDAATDTRIDPIVVGKSWTYDVTIIGTYPLCKAGLNTGRVLGEKVVSGKPAFQVQSFCPGFGTSSYAVDGDKVELYYGNAWILSLDSPVQPGHTWTDGVYTYAWENAGSVTVPAGTYNDCWTARPTVGTSYTTLCRGIGPVRWHFVDASGNGYDAKLTATAP